MYNQEQYNYVKSQLKTGFSETEVRAVLADSGYDPVVIDLLLKDVKEELEQVSGNIDQERKFNTLEDTNVSSRMPYTNQVHEPGQSVQAHGSFDTGSA